MGGSWSRVLDFSDSTKNDLDSAATSGNICRQKLSHVPVSFQEERQPWVLETNPLLPAWFFFGDSARK